jgi:hypothetical protein
MVAYLRLRPEDVWGVDNSGNNDVCMAQPRWITLKPSPVIGSSVGGGGKLLNGRILVRIGMDRASVADAPNTQWPLLNAASTVPFGLFVHVFQARSLPAADENGRLDPYLKVKCECACASSLHSDLSCG